MPSPDLARQPLLDLPIIDPLPVFEALLIKSYAEFKKLFKSLGMGTTMKRYPRFQGANVLCMGTPVGLKGGDGGNELVELNGGDGSLRGTGG